MSEIPAIKQITDPTAPLHDKLRLELIIESPALRRAEDVLIKAGVSGFTVLPALAGYGGTNSGQPRRWSRGTDISAATDMVMLVCISDSDILLPSLTALHDLLDRHIGVLNVSAVSVLRDHRF